MVTVVIATVLDVTADVIAVTVVIDTDLDSTVVVIVAVTVLIVTDLDSTAVVVVVVVAVSGVVILAVVDKAQQMLQ